VRRIALNVTRDQAQFLEQECKRLEELVGKKVTIGEVVQLLVECHQVKMQMIAESNPESISWMYRWLADHPSDKL
jgi:hypothetical protein